MTVSSDALWDVIIAGAGPAGLSAALAIRAAMPAVAITVLERARAMHPNGGNIGLIAGPLFKAFRAIGPNVEQAVLDASLVRHTMITCDKDGSNRKEMKNVNARNASWYDLQQALLSQLPEGIVQLGHGVQEVAVHDGIVHVTTASGAVVRGRVLIGADGNRSAVREYVQPGLQADYAGAAVWRFFMTEPQPFVNEGEALVVNVDGKAQHRGLQVQVLAVAPAIKEGTLVTYCSGLSGFPQERLAELNQSRYIQGAEEGQAELQARLRRFQACFEGYHPELLAFIHEHAVASSCLEHPMWSLNPKGPWHRGCVAVSGDAAHAMPPNMAQGTPMAIEDAVQLAASLQAHGLTEAALAHYEEVRKQRVVPIWQESHDGAVAYYQHGDDSRNPFKPSPNAEAIYALINSYDPPDLQAPAKGTDGGTAAPAQLQAASVH